MLRPVLCTQAFYVSAPISSDWPPGEERNFFFYSALANVASEEQMHCIPHRVWLWRTIVGWLRGTGNSHPAASGSSYQLASRVFLCFGTFVCC